MFSSTRRDLNYLTARFFDGLSTGLILLALPWYILTHGGTGSFVASIALVCTITSFALTPLLSTFIDRYSRKTILIANQVIQAAVAFVVALCVVKQMASPLLLGLCQVIYWVTMNMAWSTNNAFTQENWQPSEYAGISGKQEIVAQMTVLLAGATGVIMLENWGLLTFSLVAAFASMLSTFSYLVTPHQRRVLNRQQESVWRQLKQSKDIVWADKTFFAFIFAAQLGYPVLTFLGQLVPIWLSEQGASGSWFASYQLLIGLGAITSGLLIKRIYQHIALEKILPLGALAMALAVYSMSWQTNLITFVALAALFGFFKSVNRVTRANLMHLHTDGSTRGRAEGVLGMMVMTVQSFSYIFIAAISAEGQTELGFTAAAGVLFLSALVMTYLLARLTKERRFVTNECTL
ncbi:MFS transporter [Salinibius halmophilus]|uniref:MFS transporter n=1 Tax=Salinibius halmophilus TaxID=1853216 RepID=UPI000E660442|nr:MFS transporter [Salinibius halmophilus]